MAPRGVGFKNLGDAQYVTSVKSFPDELKSMNFLSVANAPVNLGVVLLAKSLWLLL
jgi:hypothetical protein